MDDDDKLPPIPRTLIRVDESGERITYKVGKKLGSGGFAFVHEAEDITSGSKVALKCISKQRFDDTKFKKKVMTEIDIHRNLKNEYITEYKGVFQDENYVYLVLELCTKGNVLELLRKKAPFTENQASAILRQMLNSLAYVHSHGVIHHDVKLQNFLITEDDKIKLADFGLSKKMAKKKNCRHSSICGTPGYISPELVERSPDISTAVDIWALGVCTFLMLTAHQPFHVKDRKQTYKNIRHISYSYPPKIKLTDDARSFIEAIFQKNQYMRPKAEELLNHPFISRIEEKDHNTAQITMPHILNSMPIVNSIDEEDPTTINDSDSSILKIPQIAVKMWCDYTQKYGLAYILYNGTAGAYYNDSSQIVMDPDGTYVQYWANPAESTYQTHKFSAVETSPIKKKMLIIQRLAEELKKRSQIKDTSQSTTSTESNSNPIDIELHRVKYWTRKKDGIMFKMSNKDVQVIFKDHRKIYLQSLTKTLYYDKDETTIQIRIADLLEEKYKEVRSYFYTLKKMAKQLK